VVQPHGAQRESAAAIAYQAGLAHLYFVSIHRFEGLGQPTLIALAATILGKRKAYYDALEMAGR
jgi:hypothetical protein